MTYRDWHVGMKVVCVKDARGLSVNVRLFPTMPEKGAIFTLSRITTDWLGRVAVQVSEVENPVWRHQQGAFPAYWFRPLAKRKTDISIFTAMLTGAKEREPA